MDMPMKRRNQGRERLVKSVVMGRRHRGRERLVTVRYTSLGNGMGDWIAPTTYYMLLTTYYLLLTTFYVLLTCSSLLPHEGKVQSQPSTAGQVAPGG